MYPNPWVNTAPPLPPSTTQNIPNSFENNARSFPFYTPPNAMQNLALNPQSSLTLNPTSMTQPFHSNTLPNAIDPAMVQKWQEWKQWELWQQQFQQWQQQTAQIAATTGQPPPPPIPQSQPLQPPQLPSVSIHQPLSFYQQVPTIQSTSEPLQMKRSLEPGLQTVEKKFKTDDSKNKKDQELNNETEAFEEQFKSWEEQFLKWKEQNKNHPDKIQYQEYEKKWLNWRDQLKQKCDLLKKKKEAKLAEKKKEELQVKENQAQSQQSPFYNSGLSSSALPNNTTNISQPLAASLIVQSSLNQIPGLDLVSNNDNRSQSFPNVSKILPHQQGPIQTPDDKPFNFPKQNAPTTKSQSLNIPFNTNVPPVNSYSNNPPKWPSYNSSQPFYSQKQPNIDSNPLSKFNSDIDPRPAYSGGPHDGNYNIHNNSITNVRRSSVLPFTKPSEINNSNLNIIPDSSVYNKNNDEYNSSYSNRPPNFSGFNTVNSNFNKPAEISNISYPYNKKSVAPSSHSKPPSLLSLNVSKPISMDESDIFPENKDVGNNRYERNWNITEEEENPEDEYMEAHKKFSSEPYNDPNEEDEYFNDEYNNKYINDQYSRGNHSINIKQGDYLRPSNQMNKPQITRNQDLDYSNNHPIWNSQTLPNGRQISRHNDDYCTRQEGNNRYLNETYQKVPNHLKNSNEEFMTEPVLESNKFLPNRENYAPPPKGSYGPNRGRRFDDNRSNSKMDWGGDFNTHSDEQQQISDDNSHPKEIVKPSSIEDIPPIDPVKLFDYRHLPALKVIPGLSKETIIPVRIYDYKHGGKRKLPWQDRGFSRRNITNSRDLNEKEEISSENPNLDKNDLFTKSLFESDSLQSKSKDYTLLDQKINNLVSKVIKDKKVDVFTDKPIVKDEQKLHLSEKFTDIYPPSPPRILKPKEEVLQKPKKNLLLIETLLCPPGRLNRPEKIVIILRGLPGSGKSHIAKLIKEKEISMGGQAPRILSLDDYFMTEVTKIEIDPETNKKVEKKVMEYEHDSANESLYRTSFIKAFKKKVLENYFSFYIIDAINNKVTYYKDILDIAKVNGFTGYVIELESDVELCIKNNIHKRTTQEINNIMRSWVPTPPDQMLLDVKSLLQSNDEVEMEDVSDIEIDLEKNEGSNVTNTEKDQIENKDCDFEEEDVDLMKLLSCKWVDNIPQEEKMNRLDGLRKKKPENSIKEWLQIPETEYVTTEHDPKDGKKRVRWADIEEQREQEKIRAIGFVVGQTDWNRMLGQDQGESKLTQTKYI
ncbi:YLP motif-containing protein 1-like isoform X2 [Daktulosphaira vitifoliae]|uniref:YLP motif-containing protein 1-like isoform X2 n=1 Tax=Daktulosphaira vitifoliae TaxID=58002 RepID=UPI0021AA590D|nr:YLP motif-containing protein 1-like isoform X2 [Daktulosphaira vitifoliae]